MWPHHQLDSGPDPALFYERIATENRVSASEQMLSHLVAAFDANTPAIARRNRFFKGRFVLLAGGLAGAVVIIFLS